MRNEDFQVEAAWRAPRSSVLDPRSNVCLIGNYKTRWRNHIGGKGGREVGLGSPWNMQNGVGEFKGAVRNKSRKGITVRDFLLSRCFSDSH